MQCTNCCDEGAWTPHQAVLDGKTEVEIVLCDACRDALYAEEWIDIEERTAR